MQIGITLVGVLTGVVSGAAIGGHISHWLEQFALVAKYAAPLGLGIAVVGITIFSG